MVVVAHPAALANPSLQADVKKKKTWLPVDKHGDLATDCRVGNSDSQRLRQHFVNLFHMAVMNIHLYLKLIKQSGYLL